MSNYEKKQISAALYYLKLADDCVNAGDFSCTIERMHSFIEHDLITLAVRLYALSTKGGASK